MIRTCFTTAQLEKAACLAVVNGTKASSDVKVLIRWCFSNYNYSIPVDFLT